MYEKIVPKEYIEMTMNEEKRLEALRSYRILDTGHDASFDRLTQLASAICETPIALVSLVDEGRQWFKSSVGLPGVSETPREISFCTFTIQGSSVFEVCDALSDERFKSNPLVVQEPQIRFYAGAPLRNPEGHNLGTLCVIDREPRTLSEAQLNALMILSDQVVELIEMRKLNLELLESKKRLEGQQQLLINRARLQTIGELAGGVCHQINNPLAIILGRSMILRTCLKDGDQEVLKHLDIIDQTSQRVSGILKSLRMYSKDLGETVSDSKMSEVLENAVTLMKGKFSSDRIDFKITSERDVRFPINKNQISQVVLDLLTNAVEAMEDASVREIELCLTADESNVFIRVKDTGAGVRPELRKRIFEPFFSTKGRNFGVGLSNAVTFVQHHMGEITLENEKNPTVFQIRLPRTGPQ